MKQLLRDLLPFFQTVSIMVYGMFLLPFALFTAAFTWGPMGFLLVWGSNFVPFWLLFRVRKGRR